MATDVPEKSGRGLPPSKTSRNSPGACGVAKRRGVRLSSTALPRHLPREGDRNAEWQLSSWRKAVGDYRTPRPRGIHEAPEESRSVLECGCPQPLCHGGSPGRWSKCSMATDVPEKSGRGLPPSKTSRNSPGACGVAKRRGVRLSSTALPRHLPREGDRNAEWQLSSWRKAVGDYRTPRPRGHSLHALQVGTSFPPSQSATRRRFRSFP